MLVETRLHRNSPVMSGLVLAGSVTACFSFRQVPNAFWSPNTPTRRDTPVSETHKSVSASKAGYLSAGLAAIAGRRPKSMLRLRGARFRFMVLLLLLIVRLHFVVILHVTSLSDGFDSKEFRQGEVAQ